MSQDAEIKLFEAQKIRKSRNGTSKKRYFSVADVAEIPTESTTPRDYWFKMKQKHSYKLTEKWTESKRVWNL